MHKPDYTPTLTAREFWTAWNYGPCSTEVWCFVRDLMQLFQCHGETPESTDNLTFLLVAVYNIGYQQGIRKERHRRRVKQNGTENPCREAIVRLLDKADPEALHLIWIAARNLTRKGVKPNA